MGRVLHRVSPNRAREVRERALALAEQKLAGRIICSGCKATGGNYPDRCRADHGQNCPAEHAWDAAVKAAMEEVARQ